MKREYFLSIIVISVLSIGWTVSCSGNGEANPAAEAKKPGELPGFMTGEAPWPPERNHLRERLDRIGLPGLNAEGTVVHSHQHLDLFIHGHPAPVPAGIGIHPDERFISHIHTHDPSGEIHIESPSVQVFNLGQFFDIWGVRLTAECIGGYCKDGGNTLRAFVDGKPVEDPRSIRLEDRQEIVIAYGTAEELPNPVPASYAWPE